jgi:hypothetical protein
MNMADLRENRPVLHTKKHIARLERERRQTRLILLGFISIIVSVFGLILYAVLYPRYIEPTVPVAKVGSVDITVGQWKARVRLERRRLINQLQLYQQYSRYFGMDLSSQEQQIRTQLSASATLGQTVVDQLINEELIRQESAKRGITTSSGEVDSAIQAAFQFYPAGTPTPSLTPTPVSFPTLSPETLALVTITPTATLGLAPTASPTSTPDGLASPTPTIIPSGTVAPGPSPTAEYTATAAPTSTPYTQEGFENE